MGKSNYDEYLKSNKLLEIANSLNYQNEDDLFAAIGYGKVSLHKITNKFKLPDAEPIHQNCKEYIEKIN